METREMSTFRYPSLMTYNNIPEERREEKKKKRKKKNRRRERKTA